jgi:predicted AAA+ superfamily ATPase
MSSHGSTVRCEGVSAMPFHCMPTSYPIDPGLISLYERTGRANLGHALETVILLELERRG